MRKFGAPKGGVIKPHHSFCLFAWISLAIAVAPALTYASTISGTVAAKARTVSEADGQKALHVSVCFPDFMSSGIELGRYCLRLKIYVYPDEGVGGDARQRSSIILETQNSPLTFVSNHPDGRGGYKFFLSEGGTGNGSFSFLLRAFKPTHREMVGSTCGHLADTDLILSLVAKSIENQVGIDQSIMQELDLIKGSQEISRIASQCKDTVESVHGEFSELQIMTETERLRVLKRQESAVIREAAISTLPPALGYSEKISDSLSEVAALEAEKAELEVLKRQLITLTARLRNVPFVQEERIKETGRDIAQCYCGGIYECQNLFLEMPP